MIENVHSFFNVYTKSTREETVGIKEEKMKKIAFLFVPLAIIILAWSGDLSAQRLGPSDAMIKENFTKVLKEADKNKDGKLSMQECMTIWKDKKKGEESCKYWDANGDGTITEDEYVKQVRKIMK